MSILEVKNLYYSLSQRAIIEDFNLIVNPGEILTLFGPSGCGKSTFLKLVSGILRPNGGKINLNSKIAYMFQEHRLFENLSAYENIALVMQKEDSKWIYEMLNELGITSLDAKRYPAELSGGMRARVAFVRTMAANARLILLDEPFSGLDFA
ncbi:MAG: ABC transporter ATP-binding protein, partial [Campylobacter sp.]|nr:ABC transporter ATP-binding protein [Campylobacter sp.]